MKKVFISAMLLGGIFQAKAQLLINEVSQGTSGNKEYIELVVSGTRACTDTAADLRGWIIDDNGGWYGTSAISQGCYRLANVASWSRVPYGSIILLYNSSDKNDLITQADDPTDANHDGVYIVPIEASVIELNPSSPNSGSGSSFAYPASGFSASNSWTPMALNNTGDAVAVIKPGALSTAYHSMSYGNLSGGTVHVNGSGGQKVYYVSGSQYNNAAGWVAGSAPSAETPGAPNTPANTTWINSMRSGAGRGSFNDTTRAIICQGTSYPFNGNTYTTTGRYTFTYPLAGGCDSIITLDLTVNPVPPTPVVISPLTYCQDDVATALTATGQNLQWYTVATGGTASPVAPIPVTTTPGTTVYYVSQQLNGCESPRTNVTIQVKTKPLPPQVVSPVIYCQYQQAIALAATGQAIQWYPTATGGSPLPAAPIPDTRTPGTFSWYVSQTDNGCESNRSRIDVTINELKAAFKNNKDTVCSMDTLKLESTSSGTGLRYSWSFGDGQNDTTAAPIHIYEKEGHYTVTLTTTNAAGCMDSTSKKIMILPLPSLSFVTDRTSYCQGEAARITSTISPYYESITWDFGDGIQSISDELNPQHSYETSGTFVISVATINKGCPDRKFSDTIVVHPYPHVNIGTDTSLCPGNTPIALSNNAPDAGSLTYQWSTGATTQGIIAGEPGTYWLQVNDGQCSNADSVEIFKSCYIDIPNTFTPNGDGLNDSFFPRQMLSRQLTEFNMQIFNRWGQMIFESKSLDGRGWDGDFNGLGQPQGVYIYLITAGFANGVREQHKGNVTLIR